MDPHRASGRLSISFVCVTWLNLVSFESVAVVHVNVGGLDGTANPGVLKPSRGLNEQLTAVVIYRPAELVVE
jgi:hypothetical protein